MQESYKKRFKNDMLIELPDNLYFTDESSSGSSTPKLTKTNLEMIRQTIPPVNTSRMPLPIYNADENV